MDELLEYLREAKIFLKLDLCNGHYQIPTYPSDHLKIVFACCYGFFKFIMILFGIKKAPLHFQKAMKFMLGELVDVCIIVYLDDIFDNNWIYLRITKSK